MQVCPGAGSSFSVVFTWLYQVLHVEIVAEKWEPTPFISRSPSRVPLCHLPLSSGTGIAESTHVPCLPPAPPAAECGRDCMGRAHRTVPGREKEGGLYREEGRWARGQSWTRAQGVHGGWLELQRGWLLSTQPCDVAGWLTNGVFASGTT